MRASGTDIDYSLQLVIDSGCQASACQPVDVAPYDGTTLPLSAGTYVLRLDGVATNCRVTDRNPRRVAGEDADQAFTTNCTRPSCEALPAFPGSPRLVRFIPGSIPIVLAGVAHNCAVEGENPHTVRPAPGGTVDIGFQVTRRKRPTLTGIVQTRGSSTDDGYVLEICRSGGDPLGSGCESRLLAGNDTIQFTFAEAGAPFARQHGLRRDAEGRLVMLDNLGQPDGSRTERFDLGAGSTVVRTAAFAGSPPVTALLGGAAQPLTHGHLLVAYGNGDRVQEYDASGNVVWEIHGDPGYVYRATRIASLYRPGEGLSR